MAPRPARQPTQGRGRHLCVFHFSFFFEKWKSGKVVLFCFAVVYFFYSDFCNQQGRKGENHFPPLSQRSKSRRPRPRPPPRPLGQRPPHPLPPPPPPPPQPPQPQRHPQPGVPPLSRGKRWVRRGKGIWGLRSSGHGATPSERSEVASSQSSGKLAMAAQLW